MFLRNIVTAATIYLTIINAAAIDFKLPSPAVAGIYIEDIISGDIIVDINGDKPMVPASITKAVTSASVLAERKPDFRFSTEVYFSGPVKGGVVDGNLVIKVSGDPTLESSYFPDNRGFVDSVVSVLKRMDISCINGDIVVEKGSFFEQPVPRGWVEEDLAQPYGAGHFAANYKDNKFALSIPDKMSIPRVPGLKVRHAHTRGVIKVARKRGSDSFVTSGRIRRKKEWVALANPNPETTLLFEFKETIKKNGIKIGEVIDDDLTPVIAIYTHQSPELREILQSLMFRSDNMMAEGALRLLASGQPREKAIEHEMSLWDLRGIDTESVYLEDGSGLSRRDRITPYFMADILAWMAIHGNAIDYVNLFPKAGMEGTLTQLLPDSSLAGKLVLKSGSMNGVQCFAGYKIDEEGFPTHVVVIMVNNFRCGRAKVKDRIEQLLLDIFATEDMI